jgi:hypothetical protein
MLLFRVISRKVWKKSYNDSPFNFENLGLNSICLVIWFFQGCLVCHPFDVIIFLRSLYVVYIIR